ncbi:MAG TPA: RNA polymerase sigma-70 factor, partial [Parafilimonas sp.]|nr:RNA polymerase sigma-70 factor [Parafilimonas sp.]
MEYRLLCEEMLLKLLKANDDKAFQEIYKRYWRQLYQSAYIKTRSHDTAEEIVQNIFVSLWEKRTSSSIEHLESYLQSAVKYRVINYFKSFLVKEKYLKNLKNQYSETEDTSATDLLLHELNALIDKAIRELPEKTQIIFNLSRTEHYTVKQISESMHLSEKAVEYHITKSLKQLRFY